VISISYFYQELTMPVNQRDFDSLTGAARNQNQISRREFVKVALGAGFAAAVLPVCAQTVIKTDTEGLDAGEFMLNVSGQNVPVYRAQPAGKKNLPVILVISEIFGVHEHIADVARRFAKQGYLALAPELFIRQGDVNRYASVAELMKEVIAKVPDAQVMGDLDALVDWAKNNGGNPDKIGITGFCWGGRITWLYVAHNPELKAGVAWYGRLLGTPTELNPSNPIDIAGALKTPVLGLYGGKDTGIPVASVEQMRAVLDKGQSGSELIVYPDSGHAFHADYRPSYVAADAKDGWTRCLKWFAQHGLK
jgi:carboxymethylenebutenolidase